MTRIKVVVLATLLNNIRLIQICLFSVLAVSSVFATDADLTGVLTQIYCVLYGIIPVMAFTLFILAGVAYGIGNFFGAEVRAKANSWAMSCITGAIIALIIVLFSDMIVNNLLGSGYNPSSKC